jgi:hypothetical protein
MKMYIQFSGTYEMPDDDQGKMAAYQTTDINACIRKDVEYAKDYPEEMLALVSDLDVTIQTMAEYAKQQRRLRMGLRAPTATDLARAWSGDNEPGDTRVCNCGAMQLGWANHRSWCATIRGVQ